MIIIADNISHRIEEKQKATERQEAIAQEQLEKQMIEEEKQNTPKPEIKIITDLSGAINTTGILLEFTVSNADNVFVNNKPITASSSYSLEVNLYSTDITLKELQTRISITAENKYWKDSYSHTITRAKTKDELKAEEVALEEKRLKESRKYIY